MYIKRIILKNIRGFEELDFDLTRSDGTYAGWTVFTGDNGSGKSTLLKAIAIGLSGKDAALALQPSFHRWIRAMEMERKASIQLDIVDCSDDDLDAGTLSSNLFDVFLSYNSQDKSIVRELAQELQSRNLRVWMDEEQLMPGRPWQEGMEALIQSTSSAVVLIGNSGLGPWEEPEMRACLSQFVIRKMPVIPVLLPGAPATPDLPLFLRSFSWVDLRGGLTDQGLERLQWGITGIKPKQSPIRMNGLRREYATKLTLIEDVNNQIKLIEAYPSNMMEGRISPIWSDFFFSNRFCCGYGPFRRMFGASAIAMQQMMAFTTERFVTLFQEAASLTEVDQWLKILSHKSLEGKTKEQEQQQLILKILCDDLLPNQIQVDGMDSDGLWLRDRNGAKLTWSDMSDGYRSALALLADILRHLLKNHEVKDLVGRWPNGKIFIKRSGVVLIDEIDAHLHPEWQQKIGFWLKRHFPNIQFLVTTHSPIICQAADDNGLFVLPEPGSHDQPKALSKEEYNKVIASRPDTILLTSAFGLQNTRSPRAVEGRAEFAKLKAKRRAGAQLMPREEAQLSQLEVFGENEEEL
jgi:predicted ATP-binding protein involved in virulence